MHSTRKMICLAACLLVPHMSAYAHVHNGNKNVNITLYGQVNRAIMHFNDGRKSSTTHVDNDTSSSRIGLKAESAVNDCFKLGGKLEYELEADSSKSVNQSYNTKTNLATENKTIGIRHAVLWLKNNDYGTLSLGHSNMASDGATSITLSKAKMANYTKSSEKWAGGMDFHRSGVDADTNYQPGAALASAQKISAKFSSFDLGQKSRVAYYSPDFYGVSIIAAHSNGDVRDLTVRYMNSMPFSFKVKAAVTAMKENARNTLGGSAALKHQDSGLNLAFGRAKRKMTMGLTANDPYNGRNFGATFNYMQVGFDYDFFKLGATSFAVDHFKAKNMTQDDERGKSYGMGIVQHIKKLSAQVYFGARTWKLSQLTQTYEKARAIYGGLYFKMYEKKEK